MSRYGILKLNLTIKFQGNAFDALKYKKILGEHPNSVFAGYGVCQADHTCPVDIHSTLCSHFWICLCLS